MVLASCTWLPEAGPTARKVISQADEDRFAIVDVNSAVVDTLLKQPQSSFQSTFGKYGLPPVLGISVGDTVVVSIWEAAGGTLFGETLTLDHALNQGSRGVTIPDQLVRRDGTISIPFAGQIPVVGLTPIEVQELIRKRLAGKTVDPQVLVEVAKSDFDTVTVTGEVVNGARVPLSPNADRLLDMIAAAGGIKTPVYENFVRLTRDGVTTTMPMATLIDTPAENIYAWPGDVLTVVRIPQSFEAFGATGKNAQISFDQENLTVAQALGKSAGLLDERADPAGVFLLRLEPASLVHGLTTIPARDANQPTIPVVYHFDLDDTKTYFLAQRFPMADKDIIYVANAQSNAIQKFFSLLATLTGPIVTGVVLNNSAP